MADLKDPKRQFGLRTRGIKREFEERTEHE
jgi:hypothetical protein